MTDERDRAHDPSLVAVEGLADAIRSASCLLFAGADLRLAAGLTSWKRHLTELMERRHFRLDEVNADLVTNALKRGEIWTATELLELVSPEPLRQAAVGFANVDRLPSLYRDIGKLKFASVITENWDTLLERAFASREPIVATPDDVEDITPRLPQNPFVILKLHGDAHRNKNLILTPREYNSSLASNAYLHRFIAWLAEDRTIFFCGLALKTIDRFLATFGNALTDKNRVHYALAPEFTGEGAIRKVLESRYGLKVIPYHRSGPRGARSFLQQLETSSDRGSRTGRRQVRDSTASSEGAVTRVVVRNIGPFREAEASFDTDCNVVLGSNGVGKSTLLRAIALGLAGDTPESQLCAGQLLNTGAREGSIELTFGSTRRRVVLTRSARGVKLSTDQLSPLETERQIVLGFSALRGLPESRSSGPTSIEYRDSVVGDLLPLLRGDVDHRLASVEQWLINVCASQPAGPPTDVPLVVKTFFDLISDITPGVSVGFGGLDRENWRVMVRTDDGAVPFEQLSQGMNSTYALVGTLVQRLTDETPWALGTRRRRGIVLVDEIDAHLHPEWQQSILPWLRRWFRGVQFIVTSHSPLLVSGVSAKQVTLAVRDEREPTRVELKNPDIDVYGLRADQILTSSLFGLITTRHPKIEESIRQYVALQVKKDKSPQEQAQLRQLRGLLTSVLVPGETDAERGHHRMEKKMLVSERDRALKMAADGTLSEAAVAFVKKLLQS